MQERKQKYYIASGFEWREGEIISNATFEYSPHKSFFLDVVPLEVANNKDYLARRKTELRLEQYRAEVCPHLPSRKNAVFLNATPKDAERWRWRGARANYNLYELLVRDEQNSCETNYIWYNYCVRLLKSPLTEFKRIFGTTTEIDFQGSIQSYWENEPTERFECPSELEVLYVGTLEVIQRIV
jgi:hypothetical protein